METPHDVWVLAGQSNMEGCGLLCEALPPDERVWSFTTAGHWEVAREPLHRFWESFTSVHVDLLRAALPEVADKTNEEMALAEIAVRPHGAGLGLSFGMAVADATGNPVGLIPAAHGGTSLGQWSQELAPMGGGSLYGGMLERVRRAGGKVRGLLWYQGESDCSPADARTYAARFDAWIAAARRDLGEPDLPVAVVQLGRWIWPGDEPTDEAWDIVREALADLPNRVPNTVVVSAIDLPLADGIHISATGLVRLGRRLAQAIAPLAGVPGGRRTPAVTSIETGTATNGLGTVTLRCADVQGGWRDEQPLYGFEVRVNGAPMGIVGAEVRGDGGSDIRLTLEAAISGPVTVAYALGTMPVATVVDRGDMPLCAFRTRAATPA